jgi:hypothetical protein
MGWESGRAGFREVPGTENPVVFKCPSLGMAVEIFATMAVIGGIAWLAVNSQEDPWFFVSPLFLGAGGLFVTGCVQLFVYRRIEIHPRERRLVDLKRTPFGGVTRRVYGFDQLQRIEASRAESTEDGPGTGVVVIVAADGSAIDFGNNSFDEAGGLIARLHTLTRLPVQK